MKVMISREYKFKFYLNISHYITVNGTDGQVHPHTWEFTVHIKKMTTEFLQFNVFEKAIEEYLSKYQNSLINAMEPFNRIVPTLEHVTEYFGDQFSAIIHDIGGELLWIESSETPTRSYLIDYEEDEGIKKEMDFKKNDVVLHVVDSVINDILGSPSPGGDR